MATNEFAPPAVPKASNDTGVPTPPSGTHPADPKPTVIVEVGKVGVPPVPASPNVHGSPAKPDRG